VLRKKFAGDDGDHSGKRGGRAGVDRGDSSMSDG
jgi:hypothetical protein